MNKKEFVDFLNLFQESNIIYKPYNNEKAIISLTSWKKRINRVYITLESLLRICKGFHIVLVLSIDEFPLKEKELPKSLLNLHNYFELLWVKKNYRSFKKILFTMNKYKNVPIISADDDLIYKENYAEIFYNEWKKNKNYFISYNGSKICGTFGAATLFPPNIFGDIGIKILNMMGDIIKSGEIFCDDSFYSFLRNKLNINNTKIIRGNYFIEQCHGLKESIGKERNIFIRKNKLCSVENFHRYHNSIIEKYYEKFKFLNVLNNYQLNN